MAEERVIAKKTDWETEEMPKERAHFRLLRHFTKEERENLKYGGIPQEMEDRWFWYYEDDTLYIHRSWTGTCIFIVHFHFLTNLHEVTVNRDENQYSSSGTKEDLDLLNSLLDEWA